jgi:hypothetical protein
MNCTLTSGRTEIGCRTNLGGIRAVYLFPFVDYAYSSIGGVRGVEITDFPLTTLFKYETTNASFSQTISNDDDGVSYDQSLTFTLFKQDLLTTNELNRLTQLDLRYILEFNDGTYRMGGVYNGATLENFTIDSGGSKASLNGYNLTINSTEEYAAPFMSESLVLGLASGFLLLETDFNILLETGSKIILT